MEVPQILVIALFAISLLLNANAHGKAKTGNYSFWSALSGTVIMIGFLFWGGFFN